MTVKLHFETTTCSRCGGTGTMPFSVYGGVCFKCNGSAVTLTAAGRSARKLWDELVDAACTRKQAWEVEVGDVIEYRPGKFATVKTKGFSQSGQIIDGHAASAELGLTNSTYMVRPDAEVKIRPTTAQYAEIRAQVLRRRKGATLVEEAPATTPVA
jgi:hypothetical protein